MIYEEHGFKYDECMRKEYSNSVFSAGFILEGKRPEKDTIYFRLDKKGEEPLILFLRPDEVQAMAAVLNETLWADSIFKFTDKSVNDCNKEDLCKTGK